MATTVWNRDHRLLILDVMNCDLTLPNQTSGSAGQGVGSLFVTADVARPGCWGSFFAMALLRASCVSCRLRVTTCTLSEIVLPSRTNGNFCTLFGGIGSGKD